MPSPEEIKAVIDSGAFTVGSILCVNGTLSWRLGEGSEPSDSIVRRYLRAAKEMQEVAEELVEDLMKDRGLTGGAA